MVQMERVLMSERDKHETVLLKVYLEIFTQILKNSIFIKIDKCSNELHSFMQLFLIL